MPHQRADERDHHQTKKPSAEAAGSDTTPTSNAAPRDLSHLDRVWSSAGVSAQSATRGSPHPQAGQSRGKRLTPLPEVIDVGEQLFGSDHMFEIPAPFNTAVGSGAAHITTLVWPDDVFSLHSSPGQLPESGAMTGEQVEQHLAAPIKVRFTPVANGEFPQKSFVAQLRFVARWDDQHIELGKTQLRGRARSLEDKPGATRTIAQMDHERAEHAKAAEYRKHEEQLLAESRDRVEPYPQGAASALNNAFLHAQTRAENLAKRQASGVESAADAIGTYKPRPMQPSIWWDLAEAAVVMGTTNVAGFVGKLLAKQIVSSLTKSAASGVVESPGRSKMA